MMLLPQFLGPCKQSYRRWMFHKRRTRKVQVSLLMSLNERQQYLAGITTGKAVQNHILSHWSYIICTPNYNDSFSLYQIIDQQSPISSCEKTTRIYIRRINKSLIRAATLRSQVCQIRDISISKAFKWCIQCNLGNSNFRGPGKKFLINKNSKFGVICLSSWRVWSRS